MLADPMKPYDLSDPRCVDGYHVIYDGQARCLCGLRSRWQFEHPFQVEGLREEVEEQFACLRNLRNSVG